MRHSSSLATRHCSVQPKDPAFVKDYGFLSFTKNTGKNMVKP